MNEIAGPIAFTSHNMIVLRGTEVWLTHDQPWWNIVETIRWWLTPGKESHVFLKVRGKVNHVRVAAKRISKTHIRHG